MSIRPSWIAFGWFIAVAMTAFVLFALTAIGVVPQEETAGVDVWVTGALVAGFFTGGFSAGVRVGESPVLHGLGMGLFSLVVWLGANLLFGEVASLTTWTALSLPIAAALLMLQTAAAVIGARAGVRWSRRISPRP